MNMKGRCVHCGLPAENHPDGKCRYGTFATMDLQSGKTCNDCAHCRRCCNLFAKTPTDTQCDFFPVRFVEAAR